MHHLHTYPVVHPTLIKLDPITLLSYQQKKKKNILFMKVNIADKVQL